MKEIWKSIKGYEGYYSVSNLGKVRRDSALKTCGPHDPYARVGLSKKGILKTVRVHKLVAEAFLGPCPKGKVIDHLDGNKKNSACSNLTYVTPSTNTHRSYAMGLSKQGEDHCRAKLTSNDVISIRNKRQSGWTQDALALQYKVNRRTIRDILNRRSWKHL